MAEECDSCSCDGGLASDDKAGAGDHSSEHIGDVGTHGGYPARSVDGERAGEGERACTLVDGVAAAAAADGWRILALAEKEKAVVVSSGGAHGTEVTAGRGVRTVTEVTTGGGTAVGNSSECVNACTEATRATEFGTG